MFEGLGGQEMMAEGLCVMLTHHQPYFLDIIRIIVGETLTARLGVCLETHDNELMRKPVGRFSRLETKSNTCCSGCASSFPQVDFFLYSITL